MMNEIFRTGLVAGACLAVACCAGTASARALDEAVFNLDIRGDLNGNGTIDPDELGNAFDYSSSGPAQCTVRPHKGKSPCFTNLTFATPMHPNATNTWPAVYLPQDNYFDERGTNFVACNALDFVGRAVTQGTTQTVYMRFRWDGNSVTNFDSNCWLMLNGFDWNFSGWGLYVYQPANRRNGRIGVMVPQIVAIVSGDGTVEPGKWYDVFATVTPHLEGKSKAIVNMIAVPDPKVDPDNAGHTTFNMAEIRRWENSGSGYPLLAFTPGNTTLRLGAEESRDYWTEIKAANNNGAKTFRGAIARMAMWTRELTKDEMWEVASGYDGTLLSAGAVNGSADEFSATPSADVHLATNAWRFLQRALTAEHPSISVKGALRASQAGRDHVVSISPLLGSDASSPRSVRLEVNGRKVGTYDLRFRSGRNVFVPGAFWTGDADGNVTVTLTRLAPFDAPLELDALSVSGSWQLGTANDSNSEFVREGYVTPHYVFDDPDMKHVLRANVGRDGPNSTASFHFYVAPEVAGRMDAVFTTRVTDMENNQTTLGGKARVALWLNGENLGLYETVKSKDTLVWNIPAEKFRAGMNVAAVSNAVSIAYMESIGMQTGWAWICYDYYRLELVPPRNGTLFLLR